jgi:CheY-like chemotaxis protein
LRSGESTLVEGDVRTEPCINQHQRRLGRSCFIHGEIHLSVHARVLGRGFPPRRFSDLMHVLHATTLNVMGTNIPPLLIIDDDPDAHFLLGRCLVHAGIHCKLHTARDAEAGIEYFGKCERGELLWPYVVFLDIKMPGADGFSVLEWLQQRNLLGNTLVAMMSSSDHPRDVSRSFSLGAHTYLNKAVRPEVLGPIVKSAITLAEQHRKPQSP